MVKGWETSNGSEMKIFCVLLHWHVKTVNIESFYVTPPWPYWPYCTEDINTSVHRILNSCCHIMSLTDRRHCDWGNFSLTNNRSSGKLAWWTLWSDQKGTATSPQCAGEITVLSDRRGGKTEVISHWLTFLKRSVNRPLSSINPNTRGTFQVWFMNKYCSFFLSALQHLLSW